jgi:hypothetical protein
MSQLLAIEPFLMFSGARPVQHAPGNGQKDAINRHTMMSLKYC